MKVSVMQPYAFPYEGYFRLLADVDLFVVYDCVQFPRRGWVHRNKLPDRAGVLQWLTLPLEHAPFDARIQDLRFVSDARERFAEEMRRFPAFDAGRLPMELFAFAALVQGGTRFVPYAVNLLFACCHYLGINRPPIVYSSELRLPEDLRAQDRILEICRRLRATRYLNSPGGVDLYEREAFAEAGVELEFLPPWTGATGSVLHKLSNREVSVA